MTDGRATGARAGKAPARRAGVAIVVLLVLVAALFLIAPAALYLWIKAVHVIAVIAWMAGLLYLPRLFVYHAGAESGSALSETFKVMERRLLDVIMTPAMIVTWALGLWLAWEGFTFQAGWLWIKIAAVVGLTGVDHYLRAAARRFAEDRNERPARHWRLMNEVPTLLIIVIVVMVIVKPL